MKKYHVYLTYDERRTIINILINKKNELIMTGHYTDAIDEVLEKLMKAKVKKVRVKEEY
ncbi:MAG: hypothetical protein IJH07_00905 [Ruminococcus sp.]|nr:hypothetical protein [Ruminococcus sp.]